MSVASNDRSARSAAEWFAVMRGPEAEDERVAFETWHALPENAAAFAELETTWDQSLFLANRPAGRTRDLSRARRFAPRGALLAAGIGALAIVSGGLVASQPGWFGRADIERSVTKDLLAGAELRTIRLADGSRATLDRDSALRDRSSANERRLILLRGRVRFDVAHDAKRPFIVDAGSGRVVAHGTIFDVGFEGQAVRVTLLRGSVEVRERAGAKPGARTSRFLAPGEELLVAEAGIGATSRANAAAFGWPDPMIAFDDTPLAEAVARFNGGGGPKVRLDGAELASRRVSGAFRRDDPRGFADALAVSFGLEVESAADGSLVLRHRASSDHPAPR